MRCRYRWIAVVAVGVIACSMAGCSGQKVSSNLEKTIEESSGTEEDSDTMENDTNSIDNTETGSEESVNWEAMAGKVTFPEQYRISYDIEQEDGSIMSVTRAKDSSGNIYYSDSSTEEVFVKNGSSYELYVLNTEGKFEQQKSSKYKENYIDKCTAAFTECASQDTVMASSAMQEEGTIEVSGRNCKHYSVSVSFANFTQVYEYAFDEKTGICLAKTEQKAISGYKQEDGNNFTCTEFETSDVTFDLP